MITLNKISPNVEKELAIDISNFQLLPYGIFYLNSKRQITFWNKACETLTGYKFEDIKDFCCYELNMCGSKCSISNSNFHKCPVLKSLRENLFINTNFSIKRKDGTELNVCGYITPVKNSKGHVDGVVVFFKKDNGFERLYELNKELAKNREAKNELLTVLSHDLRIPIASLLCYFSVFFESHSDNLTLKQLLFLKNMKKICISMLKMLNSILDVTAIESGKLTLNKTQVNMREILDINTINSKFMADQKDIDIKIEIDSDLPDLLLDKDKFQQVLDNLISNAIKFSYPNTSILIEARKTENDVFINVIDEGQGIPEDELNTIFEPFSTASVRPTGKELTSGIGLSIVKKIVEMHDGSIDVHSEVNRGTKFTVKFPF